MTTTRSTDSTAELETYLPAVVQPSPRLGVLEQLLTRPFRRDRAARRRAR